MWEGERPNAKSAELGALETHANARALRVAGGHAGRPAAPVRADAVALSAAMPARDAFALILATHAAAIAENLRCVLTDRDPEGAHQLRVTLRRLRTAMRVFKPIVRREQLQRINWVAKYIGAIAGELRDTDVIIEMLRPSLGSAPLPYALEVWREETRAKVRESLQAARAASFASDLVQLAESGAWRAKGKGRGPVAMLIDDALEAMQARVAALGERMHTLSVQERHDLRKDVKTLRYTADLSAPFDDRATDLAASLKRLQTTLGELNDMHVLDSLGEHPVGQAPAVAALRERLRAEHAQQAPELIALAARRWSELVAGGELGSAQRPRTEAAHRIA